MEQLGSNYLEILFLNIFRKSVEKIQVSFKYDKEKTDTLHEDLYSFLIISRSVLFRNRNTRSSEKRCTESQNTHFMFNNSIFSEILPSMRQCRKIL